MTGDVTGSELAEVCQQSHLSVIGLNRQHNQGKMYMNSEHMVAGSEVNKR